VSVDKVRMVIERGMHGAESATLTGSLTDPGTAPRCMRSTDGRCRHTAKSRRHQYTCEFCSEILRHHRAHYTSTTLTTPSTQQWTSPPPPRRLHTMTSCYSNGSEMPHRHQYRCEFWSEILRHHRAHYTSTILTTPSTP